MGVPSARLKRLVPSGMRPWPWVLRMLGQRFVLGERQKMHSAWEVGLGLGCTQPGKEGEQGVSRSSSRRGAVVAVVVVAVVVVVDSR